MADKRLAFELGRRGRCGALAETSLSRRALERLAREGSSGAGG